MEKDFIFQALSRHFSRFCFKKKSCVMSDKLVTPVCSLAVRKKINCLGSYQTRPKCTKNVYSFLTKKLIFKKKREKKKTFLTKL